MLCRMFGVQNGLSPYPERRVRIRTFSVPVPMSTGTEDVRVRAKIRKRGTEYGTYTEVFENAKYGYGTENEFF